MNQTRICFVTITTTTAHLALIEVPYRSIADPFVDAAHFMPKTEL